MKTNELHPSDLSAAGLADGEYLYCINVNGSCGKVQSGIVLELKNSRSFRGTFVVPFESWEKVYKLAVEKREEGNRRRERRATPRREE